MTERKFPHGLALLVILLHRGFSLWMFCVKFGSGGLIRVCSSSRNNPRHCALIGSGKTKSAFVQYSSAAFSHSLHTSALLIHKCRLAFSAVWIMHLFILMPAKYLVWSWCFARLHEACFYLFLIQQCDHRKCTLCTVIYVFFVLFLFYLSLFTVLYINFFMKIKKNLGFFYLHYY